MNPHENQQAEESEFKERLKKYCDDLTDIINASNERFEKQLSYISGGALALSFIVIEKVLKDFYRTEWKIILVIGWVLLGATLLINLLSHQKAIEAHSETIKHIKHVLSNGRTKYDSEGIRGRNEYIHKLNKITLILLTLGMTCLILYTSINLLWRKM